MLSLKVKRGLSFLLSLCLILSMLPMTVFADSSLDSFNVGDIKVTTTKDPPMSVENAVWVLVDSNECNKIVHTHEDKCYYKSCNHNDGHLSTCYSESTSYALCEHSDDTQHTASVTLTDVVTINGTNVSWKTDHPAYSVVRAVYQTAYDEAYANAKYLKDIAAKAAGVAALVGKTFCYTTSASATPDLCTHGECSAVGGSCYTKVCVLSEHTHTETCFQYTWELKADINKNGIADDADTYYTVKYVSDGTTIFEESVLVGLSTPSVVNPLKPADAQYTYTFVSWDTPIADTVIADATYTAVYSNTINKYTVTWLNEDGAELEKDVDVEYGQVPVYNGVEPSKQGDNTVTYTFAGWAPSVDMVTGDVTYTATYTTKNVFSVEFYIDGQYVKTEYVVDGETVENYLPTKTHYALSDWSYNGSLYDFSTPVVDHIRLDAKWELKEFVVQTTTPNASPDVVDGTIYPVGQNVPVTITPNDGYVIDEVTVNGVPVDITYSDKKATLTIVTDDITPSYTIVAKTSVATLVLNDAEMNVYGDLNSTTIFDAVYDKTNSNPNALSVGDVKVEYLAYSIEILNKTYDWWVTPETNVSLEKFLDQYGLGAFASYIPVDIMPHNFGTQGAEIVRVSFAGNNKYPEMIEQATVTLKDNRIPTQIFLNKGVSVVYGATEEEILALVFDMIVADDTLVTNSTMDVTIQMDSLNAGVRKATVIYNGNKTYGASTATVEVEIRKAPSYVDVDSVVNKYGTEINVSDLIDSNANCVEIIAGLKTGDNITADAGTIIYVNLPELIDVDAIENETVKSLVEKIMNGATDAVSRTMTITQLRDALTNLLPYVEKIEEYGYDVNLTADSISALILVLQQMEKIEEINNISINVSIGEDIKLTDAGIYLIAGVTSDANYVTSFGGNYAVVYPDGYKTELDWKIHDANGIITIDALKNGYDLDAYVSKVYEGTTQDAEAHLNTLFIGVDSNGKFVITDNQNELTYGAYTELAFITDFGNTMYYAKPIVRSFVVTKDVVNVNFVDENGNINHERLFAYGADATMNAYAFDRITGEMINGGTMTYVYFGIQTNGEVYHGNTAPTKPGAYTVLALYIGEDETKVGSAAGTFIIQQNIADFDIQDVTVKYDGNSHFVTVTDTIGLQHIFIVVDNNHNVNIILPEDWQFGSVDVFATVNELLSVVNGLELPEQLMSYRVELLNKLNEILSSLDAELDINSIVINNNLPTNVGTYMVIGIAFGNSDYQLTVDNAMLNILEADKPESEEPNEPQDPVNPDNPDNPPKDPDKPVDPSDPVDPPKDPDNGDGDENKDDDNKNEDNKNDVPSSPQTGDSSNIVLWFMLMITSGLAMILLLIKRNKY